jgi:hypothetical protein
MLGWDLSLDTKFIYVLCTLYGLDHVLKAWFPNAAMFRGGALGK